MDYSQRLSCVAQMPALGHGELSSRIGAVGLNGNASAAYLVAQCINGALVPIVPVCFLTLLSLALADTTSAISKLFQLALGNTSFSASSVLCGWVIV